MKDELFFVARGGYGDHPLKKDVDFKWPIDVKHDGNSYRFVSEETFQEISASYISMRNFIQVALPLMGLNVNPNKPISVELLNQLTINIKRHNAEKEPDED